MVLTVRASGDPLALAPGVREAVRAIDPSIAVSQVRPMSAVVGTTLALRRFTLRLLEAFSLVAVLLAGVGVYGVITVTVGERRAEMGLRKALGAAPTSVVGGVLGEGLGLAVVGAGVGLLGGVFMARGMAGLLYGVSTVRTSAG